MVGVTGFEPTTPASRRQCSTRLSYTPTQDEENERPFCRYRLLAKSLADTTGRIIVAGLCDAKRLNEKEAVVLDCVVGKESGGE